MWVRTLLLAALAAVTAFAGPASAQGRGPTIEPGWVMPAQDRGENRQQEIRSVREVIGMLRARFGGEHVSVELEQGARPTYSIRWRMPDGSYRDFRVDAVSGQIR